MPDHSPTADFRSAALGAMRLLHQRLGFDLWMIARAEGEDWILLHALEHGVDRREGGVGLREGTVLAWADTLCHEMVLGHGPRIAPRVADVPAYAQAAMARRLTIGAYAGAPMTRGDGSLLGTLCAVHPTPLPEAVAAELPLLELLSRLLSQLLDAEGQILEQSRRAERAVAAAVTDELTGLYNRRGWEQMLAAEQSRCRRHAHAACVLSLDIDGLKRINDTRGHAAGDALLSTTADCLRRALRGSDVVARVGGDEFALLAVETDREGGAALAARLRAALAHSGVGVSIGLGVGGPEHELSAAWQTADQAMYVDKRRHGAPSSDAR